MSLSYRYSGVKEDGTHEIIDRDFTSGGHAFTHASVSANRLRCFSNPRCYVRLEIEDNKGQPIDKYVDHEWLKCSTD